MLDLKNIIHNLPSAVIVVNPDRRVIMANKMAERFSGTPESGLINKRGGEVLGCVHATESPQGCGHGSACRFCEAKRAVVKAFSDAVDIDPFESLITTETHGPLYLKFTVTLLEGHGGDSSERTGPAAMVTVDDMTAYKKRERFEAVVETIGTICHEMNQPLTALSGQLDLLEMDIGEHQRIATFREQVDRMGRITKKLRKLRSYATRSHLKDTVRILDLEAASMPR